MEEKSKSSLNGHRTAGSVMIQRVPTALQNESAATVLKRLQSKRANWESINYVYVLSKVDKLIGVVSIRELLQAPARASMKSIMRKKGLVSQYPNSSLDLVAITAVNHNIKAVPITDKKGAFFGVVGSDAITKTMARRHVNTYLRKSGIDVDSESVTDVMHGSIERLVKLRTPWLIIGLIGQLIGASVIGIFEHTLTEVIALAFFMPLVIYMGSAIGTQAETLFVRTLAFENVKLGAYLWRELLVDTGVGLIASVFAFLFTFAWLQSAVTAGIVSIAVFINMVFAGQLAVLITYYLAKKRRDPALGAGPFITVVQDVSSLIVYFVTATILLGLFVS